MFSLNLLNSLNSVTFFVKIFEPATSYVRNQGVATQPTRQDPVSCVRQNPKYNFFPSFAKICAITNHTTRSEI